MDFFSLANFIVTQMVVIATTINTQGTVYDK